MRQITKTTSEYERIMFGQDESKGFGSGKMRYVISLVFPDR